MRNLILCGFLALGAAACGNSATNNGTPDMAMAAGGGGDMAQPTCFTGTPAKNTDFLNACTGADSVDITPFFPANAPGGVLPPLQ